MIIVEAGVLPRIKQFNMGNSGLHEYNVKLAVLL